MNAACSPDDLPQHSEFGPTKPHIFYHWLSYRQAFKLHHQLPWISPYYKICRLAGSNIPHFHNHIHHISYPLTNVSDLLILFHWRTQIWSQCPKHPNWLETIITVCWGEGNNATWNFCVHHTSEILKKVNCWWTVTLDLSRIKVPNFQTFI